MTDSQTAPEDPPRCAMSGLETLTLFGMPINNIDLATLFEAIGKQIDAGEPGFAVTPNVDHAVEFDLNPEFRRAYHEAMYVLVDGVWVMWGAHLAGKPIKEKISGSDLIYWLSEFAAERGYSVFLLGAAEGVADAAAEKLVELYPGLKIAGTHSPALGFEKDETSNNAVVEMVRNSGADICFTALGAPKQDLWNWRNHREAGAKLYLGVGASFDFVAGRIRRAPVWMQHLGLEWTWRIMQEPVRMGKRYLIRDARFLVLLWREWRGKNAAA